MEGCLSLVSLYNERLYLNMFKATRLVTWFYVFGLVVTTSYTLLETFVIVRTINNEGSNILDSSETPSSSETSSEKLSSSSSEPIIPIYSALGYRDENMELSIEIIRRYETQVYVATLHTQNHRFIQSILAEDTYGRNIRERTSSMAERKQGIFAINGDYYGFRDEGFVVRNGLLYRANARSSPFNQSVILDDQGMMFSVNEGQTSSSQLTAYQPWQAWSFGPTLIENGDFVVDEQSEVPYELDSNPRSSIGQVDEDTYLFIVSDGRTSESAGLSLFELASVYEEYGAQFAYNLDGGGSATMWFNGRIMNKPVNSGSAISERSVSDCIMIGYQDA